MRVAVLTISDATARGERADGSGDACVAWIEAVGSRLAQRAVVSDDVVPIARQLLAWCDDDACDLVLSTGGTGLSPRDVTPEATRAVLDREAPGIAERLRGVTGVTFARAALSRGVAGVRGRTLIVNLPGSTGGVRDGLEVLADVVDHAMDQLAGKDHPR